jgi:hypothetical protein
MVNAHCVVRNGSWRLGFNGINWRVQDLGLGSRYIDCTVDCKTEESTNIHKDRWKFLLLIRMEWSSLSPEFLSLNLYIQATPLQACSGPYSSRSLMLPEFLENRHMQVIRLSALCTGRLYSQEIYSWYLFLLEAESTLRPQCSRHDQVYEKFRRPHRRSNTLLSSL